MPYFKDAEELYEHIGGIFTEAVNDPGLGSRFAASGVVLKIDCTEPTATLAIDMPSAKVLCGDEGEGLEPTIRLSMKADVAHRFWLGEVNIARALGKGEMRAKGPVPKILKLVPLAKEVFPRYRARLEAVGRADLLSS